MDFATSAAFAIYLSVIVGITVVAYFYTKNLSDFVLGGRRLGGAVAALSAGASDMSAWLLLGLPGAFYAYGLNQLWLPIGLVLGAYLNWRYVAKPLRVYTEVANDSLTVPAFLDNRFRDGAHSIRIVSAIATLIFFAFYTASGLVAGALLINKTFNVDYTHALLIGTAIIIAYTFIGGFLAVSWTDFLQGNLMFVCLISVPILATHQLGGWDATLSKILSLKPNALDMTTGVSAMMIINLLAWMPGYFGQPHILVRFMSVKSKDEVGLARRVCMLWMTLSMIAAALCGFVGIAYFSGGLGNPETVFITFSKVLFSPWVAGVIMAAILSSTMCAIDSQMLASSSALTEDIYHVLIRKNASQKELMWIGRIAVIFIACIAIGLSWNSDSKVLTLVGFAWAGLGSTFGPSVVLSLFWKRMTKRGAVLGMSLGAITVIVWKFVVNHGGEGFMYEMIPGFTLSTLGVIIGSLLDTPPSKEILDEYEHVQTLLKG